MWPDAPYVFLADHMPQSYDCRINIDHEPSYEKNSYKDLFTECGLDCSNRIFVTDHYTKFEGLDKVITLPEANFFVGVATKYLNFFTNFDEVPDYPITKKFLYLSNKPRPNRCLTSRIIANCFNEDEITHSYISSTNQEFLTDELLLDTEYGFENKFLSEKWIKIWDHQIRQNEGNITHKSLEDIFDKMQHVAFNNSATSIIVEPSYYEHGNIFTEKTLMPIYSGHFLIWPGNYKSADSFKELGFDVFDDIIDHSYQYIDHPGKRIVEALLKNMDFLNDIELQLDYRNKFKDRLNHNLSLVRNISKLSDNLMKLQIGAKSINHLDEANNFREFIRKHNINFQLFYQSVYI